MVQYNQSVNEVTEPWFSIIYDTNGTSLRSVQALGLIGHAIQNLNRIAYFIVFRDVISFKG